MTDAAVIAAAGIATTFLVNYFQERRVNQKFEQQQKLELAREERQIRAAERVALTTERTAAELKEGAIERHNILAQKMDDNTALTAWAADKAAMALTEANNFERKWMVIEKMFMAAKSTPVDQAAEVRDAILDTQETSHATLDIVARELDSRDRG